MLASWCDKQQIIAFRCDMIKILDYLAFLFEKGYKYRAIWCYRSEISAFHDCVDRKPVGHQAEVCALFSEIFNDRLFQPRYIFVWSVEPVINTLKLSGKIMKICRENIENMKIFNL